MDFTLTTYKNLLETLKAQGYQFQTFAEAIENSRTNTIFLRHDIDLLPQNALEIAKIEHNLGIHSTYFFRIIPKTFNPEIIKQIADLGHEIGYHYEDLTLAAGSVGSRQYAVGREEKAETKAAQDLPFRGSRGERGKEALIDQAYELFKTHLEQLRQLYPVKTICMHGSPKSKWDSKRIWEKYDYRELGIIGEPYFDINFDEVFYLTDTGRRWDGWKVSLRDKVPQQVKWKEQGLVFHSTKDIIKAAEQNKLPDKIMITTHPQRWTDRPFPWVKEFVWQRVKNVAKYFLVKLQNK